MYVVIIVSAVQLRTLSRMHSCDSIEHICSISIIFRLIKSTYSSLFYELNRKGKRNRLKQASIGCTISKGGFKLRGWTILNDCVSVVSSTDMKIKKLMPMDAKSRRLIDWMEKGIIFICLCALVFLSSFAAYFSLTVEGPMIEEHAYEEAQNSWTKNPLRMEVGNVNNKHFVLSLKVKSMLDPCEDDIQCSKTEIVKLIVRFHLL
ncbi:hypothetical protein L1987_16440 [Smallanthus sonchifolius]|uniref:Uncharacterized protein n=1 Tax=Smallanthus sonchifolius TaxID=185202 RepID=A0ACB9JAJ6_9ASTR|nr:hypothetical protein L1987_16440 [Smallanthus sonchifolius]